MPLSFCGFMASFTPCPTYIIMRLALTLMLVLIGLARIIAVGMQILKGS